MKEESIEEQAMNATEIMIANSLMMINVYSRKKGIVSFFKHAQWKSRLRYWKNRKKELQKIIGDKK